MDNLASSAAGPKAGDDPWSSRTAVSVTLALAAGALVVRALARPGRPMWFDECISIALARAPVHLLVPQLTGGEANGGLHTLLLAGLLRITDPAGIDALLVGRGLSMAVGVLTVPALFLLGRRLLGDRTAFLAAAFLAVSRFHVFYSLEARSYALAVLLIVLAALALLALLESPRLTTALLFALLAVLATWAHLFAALALGALVLAAPLHPGFRRARTWLLAGAAIGGAGSAAVVLVVMRGDVGQVAWIGPLTWRQVVSVFKELSGGARLVLVPAVAGAAVATAAVLRRDARTFGAALALSWAAVPIALAVIVSVAKPLLFPRYLLVALPGFLLLVALGVGALPRPRIAVAAALLVVAVSVRGVARGRHGSPTWQPIDRVAARVFHLTRPGDVLVISHPALWVTVEREFARLGRAPLPELVDPVPTDPLSLRGATGPRIEERSGVIFVLALEQPRSASARAALASGARVTADEDLGGIRVLRMERIAR